MTVSSTFAAADGDGYELQMGRWSRRLAEPFLDFVGTENGECVLDVGCGTGRLAFALAQRCQIKQLRGIDFSASMFKSFHLAGSGWFEVIVIYSITRTCLWGRWLFDNSEESKENNSYTCIS